MTQRWLLCRPQGGLNDMLCQVEKCCRYAERTGRTVVVDTNYAHSEYFNDDLDRYFASRQSRLLLSPRALPGPLDAMTVFPAFLQGRLDSYTARFDRDARAFCDTATGAPVTFDFGRDHPQQLLVHHQAGGGTISLFALLRLTLQPPLVDELVRRMQGIGGPWTGVHIRDTDYATDYRPLLDGLLRRAPPRIFLATDSQPVREHFLRELGAERVHTYADALSADRAPIHRRAAIDPRTALRRNRDALLDLLLLALSRQVLFGRVGANEWGVSHSGFSLLAHGLWQQRSVLRHLVADPRVDSGLG